ALEPRIARCEREAGIVAVSRSDESAGPQDAAHLPQRRDRIRQVLQDLMRMDDVERGVGVRECVYVAELEGDTDTGLRGMSPRFVEHPGRTIDPDDAARRDPAREVD